MNAVSCDGKLGLVDGKSEQAGSVFVGWTEGFEGFAGARNQRVVWSAKWQKLGP